jgi:hypothetical protein
MHSITQFSDMTGIITHDSNCSVGQGDLGEMGIFQQPKAITLILSDAHFSVLGRSTHCEDAAVSRERLSDASRNAALANGLFK